ncbi:MAG: cell division protein FtsQ/DivIB [Xenococcus sp. (in: cyanobacteria)]
MSASYDPKLQQKFLLLQRKKRQRVQISLWRSLLVSSFVTISLGLMILPYWQIKNASQIILEEDITVAKSTIYSLLNLNYPQWLWTIPNHQLANNLKSISPIVDAVVTKQMFPPRMTVRLQERLPVASALSEGKIGFLDADGIWLDAHFYRISQDKQTFALPPIKVINFKTQYRDTWAEIYRLAARYQEIELLELRWDESAHLYLKTNIGKIYLGSDSSLLPQQFQVLARFPKLSTQENITGIKYLDLSNPKNPFIQSYSQVE